LKKIKSLETPLSKYFLTKSEKVSVSVFYYQCQVVVVLYYQFPQVLEGEMSNQDRKNHNFAFGEIIFFPDSKQQKKKKKKP